MWNKKRMLILLVVISVALAVPAAALAQTAEGTGSLVAAGDGLAVLRGGGWVRLSGEGTLVILDRGGDAIIDIEHNDRNDASFAPEHGQGGRLIFRNFNGSAYVQGSNIVVSMRGHNIHLAAKGTGTVWLRGTGWYEINGARGAWSPTGVRLELGPTPPLADASAPR